MWIQKKIKQESVPKDDMPAEGAVAAPEAPVDEDIDSEEASMFGEIDDDLFGDEEESKPVESVVEEPPVEEEPPAPAADVEAQPAEPVPPVQEVPPVTEPVAPTPPPVEQPPAPVPAVAPPEPAVDHRAQALTELEKRYTLSQEDADAMISEPETVVPRLMSQMYLDVVENVMRSVQQILPQAVTHIQSQTVAQQKDETDFYSQWPGLKAHGNEVLEIGQRYRQLNPTATKEQFIQDVGLHASIQLKIPVEGVTAAPPPPATPRRNSPYTPPQGGSVSTPPAPAKPQNEFGALMEEWDELDGGGY